MKKFSLLMACCLLVITGYTQKNIQLSSPDGKLQVNINAGEDIRYDIRHESDVVIAPSAISMTLGDGQVFGKDAKVQKVTTKNKVKETIPSPLYKKAEVLSEYNEVLIRFRGDFSLLFRAYNDGVAYRFISAKKKDFIVTDELAEFNFNSDYMSYIPYVNRGEDGDLESQYFNSFENYYVHAKLSEMNHRKLAFLPVLVDLNNGKKVCITEVDQFSYPGMFVENFDGNTTLKGHFAPYPKALQQGGHNNLQMLVKERENYIAKVKGTRSFPWRVISVSTEDAELANSDLVYKLAEPNKIGDVSWVKPGKVAWDWWNAWNLYDVDFESGINNETYKYYIDFAADHGIEYVILDEGWAVNKQADLMQVVPEIDLKEIIRYATTKNVGIILWAGYYAIDRDMENVCRHYAEMGVKGFKVDFMDRDDQIIVDFFNRMAETGAKYKLLVDFHGAFKPSGLNRTYPNVINYEGVNGLEQMKWAKLTVDQVTYEVTIPFIRQFAGPMDYTQGSMRNATKGNYRSVYTEPMSQGTRCRQLSQYVIFESPLNMLCDNPSNYMKEKECTDFIAAVPTVWDETVVLNGKIGEYVAIARRNGSVWYIGAMTDWTAREMELDLSFLGSGNYQAEVFQDGVNANKAACDYKRIETSVPADRKLNIKMAPGGGYAVRIYKR